MLSDPKVNMCNNKLAITQVLAQTAWDSGYYTSVYNYNDGGAGLIHMNYSVWALNAADMDILWPGNDYVGKLSTMGKTFFQNPTYAWRSVAAWFKLTNRVITGCGYDLFSQSYDMTTYCISGYSWDRSEPLRVAN
jgi:hypothetical protein